MGKRYIFLRFYRCTHALQCFSNYETLDFGGNHLESSTYFLSTLKVQSNDSYTFRFFLNLFLFVRRTRLPFGYLSIDNIPVDLQALYNTLSLL